jgi:hypothetical protein
VDNGRISRAWAQVSACAAGEPLSLVHACVAAARAAGAFGAGLSMARAGTLREPVYATDMRSEQLGELQSTLGEGPCVDALRADAAVLVGDVATAESGRRWPSFASAAAALGVRGMFSIPVRAGGARVGVLDLYRDRPGSLSGDELADAFTYADVLLVLALDHLGGVESPQRGLLDAAFTDRRAVVHQAAGMVSVQLDLTVTDALARLRGYAYAQDRRLADVCADVVARRLSFTPDSKGKGEP